MKEQEITPKVIELAKEIARHWRMEIYEGCWIVWNDNVINLVTDEHTLKFLLRTESRILHYVPIPSISDCLEKLRELGYESMNLQRRPFRSSWMINIWDKESHNLEVDTIKRWRNKGETLHEVLFSVLLEALKEEE